MFPCASMQFLDKVNLNYAAVMGLNSDLHLTGNDFSNASTAFYIAYLIVEVPNSYILQKLPVGKWLGGNMIVWGIATACTAATTNYTTLLLVRIFLGIFEQQSSPAKFISSQWYMRSEQAPRFSLWYSGLTIVMRATIVMRSLRQQDVLEIYHLIWDEWRVVESLAKQNLKSFDRNWRLFDIDKNLWTPLHSN